LNNNAKRLTRACAEHIRVVMSIALDKETTKEATKEILRGGGSNGGILTKILMPRPIEDIRISNDAFKLCQEHNVKIVDFFLLGRDSAILKNRYGKFFSSNFKTVEKCHNVGHYITLDHNISNKSLLTTVYELAKKKKDNNTKEITTEDIITILNKQSIDFITIEENQKLKAVGFNSLGTKEERDAVCSPKTQLKDIWLTPQHIIDQFFETSNLDRKQCFDPCAFDGRWLGEEGLSSDILPMSNFVSKQNFLELDALPDNIKHIVGNIPFSITKDFVEKSFELRGDAYFLVNGDTIMNHYNGHIKKLWIINGIEGNQKDYRSRCEFDTVILKKSALWCCIVHITKEEQEKFIIEKDITNPEKRDGYHIALGRNIFIKSPVLVEENERVIRLKTKGTINYRR